MFEKILTHQKYSRRRQAAALGFALCFVLLELIHDLSLIIYNDPPPYTLMWPATYLPRLINLPNNTFEPTRFSLLIPVLLALGGLLAGLVMGWAERPTRRLRFGLAGAVGLPAAFAAITLLCNLLAAAPDLSPYLQAFFNIFAGAVFGGLAASFFGLLAGAGGRRLLRLLLSGTWGFILGVLASIPAAFALNIAWGLIAALLALATHTTAASHFTLWVEMFLALPVIAIQGWIFGAWLGNELDSPEEHLTQLAADRGQLTATN
jgi:hypothetical protein